MNAIHWLRSRQEDSELGYWLSIVAYDQKDRTFLNRLYLFYLLIFFLVWFSVVLIFFAKYGGMVLSFLDPSNSAMAAIRIEMLVLAIWNLLGVAQAVKRSPVVFSEQDAVLVSQTPVNHCKLVLRWIWMPWFKTAIAFGFLSVMLGFSVAETNLAGAVISDHILEYFNFGLRALVVLLPFQLAMFALQWIMGVLRLQGARNRNWIRIPVILIAVLFLLVVILSAFPTDFSIVKTLLSPLENLFLTGFSNGNLVNSLLAGTGLAILGLGLLYSVSERFSFNRAAQETVEVDLLSGAARYGFTDFVEQRRLQNHLGSGRRSKYPYNLDQNSIFLWKNLTQELRAFRWKSLLSWLTIFSITLGLSLLPTFLGRILMILYWVEQVSSLSVVRLRSDLSCWTILQQLPISKKKILLVDLVPVLPTLLSVCLAALGVSALISRVFPTALFLIMPVLLLNIFLGASIDVLRRSRGDLLLTGNVPAVGVQGIILGLIGVSLPLFIELSIHGIPGIIFPLISSLLIAWIYFQLAITGFRKINA